MQNLNATNETVTATIQIEPKEIHPPHEALVFLLVLLGFQSGLLYLQKRHTLIYQYLTLAGLIIWPVFLGSLAGNTRFLLIILLWGLGNSFVVKRALQRPLDPATPRAVFRWFERWYKVCYGMGVVGYFGLMLVFFGLAGKGDDEAPQKPSWFFSTSLYLMFYGLYFGLISRDTIDLLAAYMAASVGYYTRTGLPNKHLRPHICAICGDDLSSDYGDKSNVHEPTVTLECRHSFHEVCIRGWCLLGKKDTCPYCKEKVHLKPFEGRPWDTQQQFYLQLLDFIRYMIVWQPVLWLSWHWVSMFYHPHH